MVSKSKTSRLSLFPNIRLIPPFSGNTVPGPVKCSPSPPPPPPPPTPYPWLWQCHACHAVYRLACTRRCLECSHEMCSVVDGAVRKGRKRLRSGAPCKSEFDYSGWEAWGLWRRGDQEKASTEREREDMFVLKKHNCWTCCDHPSECHHVRYAAISEGRAERIRARAALQDVVESRARQAECAVDDASPESPVATAAETNKPVYELYAGPSDFASTREEIDFDTDFYNDSSSSSSDEEEDVTAQRQEQERRSRRKVEQLTGLDTRMLRQHNDDVSSFSLHDVDTDKPAADARDTTEGGEALEDGEDKDLGWWAQHQRAQKRRKRVSQVLGADLQEDQTDDWDKWSSSSSSGGSSPSSESGDELGMDEIEVDSDEAKGGEQSHERDLTELMKLRGSFMRGDL